MAVPDQYHSLHPTDPLPSGPMRSALTVVVALSLLLVVVLPAAGASYPAKDSGYHSYPEMVSHIRKVAAQHLSLIHI